MLFDKKGEMQHIFGQQGRGPADLIRPWDIEVYNNTIFLADAENMLKKIEVTDYKLEYVGSETTRLIAVDICVMNNEIFARTVAPALQNEQGQHVIHVFSADNFDHLRSFGTTYQSPIKSTELRLSGLGNIACLEKSNTILYTFEYFPYVYAYTSDGNYKWSVEIAPFTGYELTETIKPRPNLQYSTGGKGKAQKIVTLTELGEEYVLVQVARSLMQTDDYDASIESYVISISDGYLQYYDNNTKLPYIIKSVTENAIYSRKLEGNGLVIFR